MLPQSGDGLDVDGLLRWVAAVSRLSVSFGSPARRRPKGHPMSRQVGTPSRHTAPTAGRVSEWRRRRIFYIVSSWFLATKAALWGHAGDAPQESGRPRRSSP